jgi:hypothetical protein
MCTVDVRKLIKHLGVGSPEERYMTWTVLYEITRSCTLVQRD